MSFADVKKGQPRKQARAPAYQDGYQGRGNDLEGERLRQEITSNLTNMDRKVNETKKDVKKLGTKKDTTELRERLEELGRDQMSLREATLHMIKSFKVRPTGPTVGRPASSRPMPPPLPVAHSARARPLAGGFGWRERTGREAERGLRLHHAEDAGGDALRAEPPQPHTDPSPRQGCPSSPTAPRQPRRHPNLHDCLPNVCPAPTPIACHIKLCRSCCNANVLPPHSIR